MLPSHKFYLSSFEIRVLIGHSLRFNYPLFIYLNFNFIFLIHTAKSLYDVRGDNGTIISIENFDSHNLLEALHFILWHEPISLDS